MAKDEANSQEITTQQPRLKQTQDVPPASQPIQDITPIPAPDLTASQSSHKKASSAPLQGKSMYSGKNKGNPDVFLSYSHRDQTFALQLVGALSLRECSVWFDRNDVFPSGEFREDIKAGIEETGAFLFLMTPDALDSAECSRELDYAQACGKKLIPVHYRPIDPARVPPLLRELDWIEYTSFEQMLEKILDALLTDKEDWKQAGRWLRSGSEWEKDRKRNAGLLLHGKELKKAEDWLKRTEQWQRQGIERRPQPLPLHKRFIHESRRATNHFRVLLFIAVMLLLGLTGGGLFFSFYHDPTLVTTLKDGDTGSLRWAISTAPLGSTISFAQNLEGHVLTLDNELPITQKRLSIRAPDGKKIIINSGGYQIHILSGVSLDVSNIIFTGNQTAIAPLLQNNGTLILNNCTVSGQATTNQGGGGIYNDGTLTLNKSAVIDNTEYGGGGSDGGAGIYNSAGRVFINNSIVSGNHANYGTLGGGIYSNNGTITITNSQISNNTEEANIAFGGGGIYNSGGTITIINSQVSNNTTTASGGGISNDNGTITLTKSTISWNTAFALGGGIENTLGSTLTLKESTVSNNSVTGNKLAISGGGIDNGGTLTMADSTIFGNTVSGGTFLSNGGGINNNGTLTLTNSTISGNAAANDGGGIFNEQSDKQGKVTLIFCTIYGNQAQNGGGIFNSPDTLAQGQVAFRNSLFAGNHASSHPDIAGPLLFSGGYNLIQSTSGISLQPTDLSGSQLPDLFIDPILRLNNGSTQTHAILPGSPAIDVIPLDVCHRDGITTDQRGVRRPQGSACDIGAYEYVF